MKHRIIPWVPLYSHIPQETLVQGVSRLHLNAFAPEYFKSIWINDKRSIQNLYKDDKFLSEAKLPACIVSYEIDDDPKNTRDAGDFPYNYASHFIAGNLKDYYWRIYNNPHNHIQLFAAFIRKKITITIRYLFPDVNERDNAYNWMTGTFRYGGPPVNFGNKMSICQPLPTSLIEYLMLVQQVKLDDPIALNIFNTELSAYSSGLLRLKKITMRDASQMWFLVYRLPKMRIFAPERPSKGDGEAKDQIQTNFEITEVLEVEPYVPQMFISYVPEIIGGVTTPDSYKPSTFGMKSVDDRVYKTRNVEVDPSIIDLGTQSRVLGNIEFSSDRNGEDTMDIDETLFTPVHLKIINILRSSKMNVSDYYNIFLYSFNRKLREGVDKDYTIHWEDMTIKFHTLSTDGVYRIVSSYYAPAVDPMIKGVTAHQDEKGEL